MSIEALLFDDHVAAAVPGFPRARNQSVSLQQRLALGQLLIAYLRRTYPETAEPEADPLLLEKFRYPYGFFKRFIREELRLPYTNAKRLQCRKALELLRAALDTTASSPAAMRDFRPARSVRGDGGSKNASKSCALSFHLFQYFVDEFQELRSRSDSALLLKEARRLRLILCMSEEAAGLRIPRLTDGAGRVWLQRWRKEWGIVMKGIGMQLKVSWRKILRRVKCSFGNYWRMRFFWESLFPGRPMRWISLDQKPSWFNNAGHQGTFSQQGLTPSVTENFAATRSRYTILTSVCSWTPPDAEALGQMPYVCVLFKGSPGGAIQKQLDETFETPAWMMVQTQENGSYRSSDMVDALDRILPDCDQPEDSIVVLLDWYSGHRTEEVEDLIAAKGHVLNFHGGGTTPFGQINDTHLHALVARALVQFENAVALSSLQCGRNSGVRKFPTSSRLDILHMVAGMWRSIDHHKIACVGYKQTGPTMSMDEPILVDDVYKDLRRVFAEIDPSTDPLHIGDSIREKARQRVQEGIDAGVLVSWANVHDLIQDQDEEDMPLEEGQEAWDVVVHDGDGDDDQDSDEDGDDGGLSAKALPASGSGASRDSGGLAHAEDTPHDRNEIDDCHPEPPLPAEEASLPSSFVLAIEGSQPNASSSSSSSLASPGTGHDADPILMARKLLYAEALKNRDDSFARTLRKQMAQDGKKRKAKDTPEAVVLRDVLEASKEEEIRRRADAREDERAAQLEMESKRRLTAEAKAAEHNSRRLAIEAVMRDRQQCAADRLRDRSENIYRCWLSGHFAAIVARRLLEMSVAARSQLGEIMALAARSNWFLRPLQMVHLWDDDDQHSIHYGVAKPPGGGPAVRRVRCSLSFEAMIRAADPRGHPLPREARDAVQDLFNLFGRCVPKATLAFSQLYTPLKLLHQNEYNMDKAFAYGIIALSKWLGPRHFPQGIFGSWPPQPPEDVQASMDGILGPHASASSGAIAAD